MYPRKKHRRDCRLRGSGVPERQYDKGYAGEQQREVFGVSGTEINENYREYLKAYTRHYNRNKETYGGRKITEGEAKDHATVREVKAYYEEMEGRHK